MKTHLFSGCYDIIFHWLHDFKSTDSVTAAM